MRIPLGEAVDPGHSFRQSGSRLHTREVFQGGSPLDQGDRDAVDVNVSCCRKRVLRMSGQDDGQQEERNKSAKRTSAAGNQHSAYQSGPEDTYREKTRMRRNTSLNRRT